MPHQNVDSSKATEQNSATGSDQPNDQGREQNRAVRPEPRSYVAADAADASLAPPAAGEVADYMDEGDALGDDGLQQGATHANRPIRTEADRGQGPKTRAANRRIVRGD
jgi:hypothetical protein